MGVVPSTRRVVIVDGQRLLFDTAFPPCEPCPETVLDSNARELKIRSVDTSTDVILSTITQDHTRRTGASAPRSNEEDPTALVSHAHCWLMRHRSRPRLCDWHLDTDVLTRQYTAP